ncbi:MAG TPA: Crp/Fnr family transcriptional regulator [Candidatus Acidoferrales bacterium]|jgi:CRP-like cAMP-binding protein|nr:Crp/Fnr family transcriptional regulator [Candidatus Acidoferrales bacterium]
MAIVKLQVVQAGERTNPDGKPIRNKLLLAASDEEFQLIRPYLEFINLPHHLSLHQPHRTVRFAHFPNEGLISLVVELKDGKSVEAGLLGKDGASGIPAVLGLSRSPLREVVQIAGSGFRVRISTLIEILHSIPETQVILSRYAAGLAMQVAQTAACNRLHKIEERLARWLLIAQDRLESGNVPITHDFLATMLGTDRPSVSLAAGVLQKREIIIYMRGSVRILNRKKLEQFACECYSIISQYNSGA